MSAVTSQTNGGTLSWRIAELERRVNAVPPETVLVRLASLESDMKTVKKLLWGLILSVVGASASLTLALLQGGGI